jgi:hypothetical protein
LRSKMMALMVSGRMWRKFLSRSVRGSRRRPRNRRARPTAADV